MAAFLAIFCGIYKKIAEKLRPHAGTCWNKLLEKTMQRIRRKLTKALFIITLPICVACQNIASEDSHEESDNDVKSVVIYYPHWHPYPHGDSWKGIGWTEYEYMRDTKPRFKGHKQPIVPLLGELDDSNPADVEKEIDLAVKYGVDVFLYDWYWYCGVKNMEEALEQGFLKAKNNKKIKFALMWANHDRRDAFRTDINKDYTPWLYSRHSESDMLKVIDYCIEHYFRCSNYWKVDGKLYFNIYQPVHFVKEIGGVEKTRALFKKINAKMKSEGLPEIHWACMVQFDRDREIAEKVGFDSITTYLSYLMNSDKYDKNNPLFHYADFADGHRALWKKMSASSIPYAPVVSTGFDTTPRWRNDVDIPITKFKYPYNNIVYGKTPELFKKLLSDAKAVAEKSKAKYVTVYAWNEWSEGGYLLPTKSDGYSYLEVFGEVFGKDKK